MVQELNLKQKPMVDEIIVLYFGLLLIMIMNIYMILNTLGYVKIPYFIGTIGLIGGCLYLIYLLGKKYGVLYATSKNIKKDRLLWVLILINIISTILILTWSLVV